MLDTWDDKMTFQDNYQVLTPGKKETDLMRHEAGDQVEELSQQNGGLDREHGVPGHNHLDTRTV